MAKKPPRLRAGGVVRPAPGDKVTVWWIDSGAGTQGTDITLDVNETHGRVKSIGPDPALSLPDWACSDTLVLVMCSAGADDEKTDLAAIWWPSVVEIENHGSDRPLWITD